MRIDVLTLFPEMFEGVLGASILKRAAESVADPAAPDDPDRVRPAIASYHLHDIRAWTTDKHSKVDQPSFGGGPGMVMQCQPVWDAVQAVEAEAPDVKPVRVLMTPQGEPLTQPLAEELAGAERLLIIAGHYEGIDERVATRLKAEGGLREVSIGDYVLSGGELPAMVLIDTVIRLLPRALGHEASAHHDSFSPGSKRLLDHPHYTRPREWAGMGVPEVLLSGNHKAIEAWREQEARKRTSERRPDLLGPPPGKAMPVVIRDALPRDAKAIASVLTAASPTDMEAKLVRDLEEAGDAIFSIVAEVDGQVVGHVMLSPIKCDSGEPASRGALGLAPVAVAPELHGRGIGSALVRAAIRQCESARVPVVYVFGDPGYYGRFGFKPASTWGWTSDYEQAGDAFQALPLKDPPPISPCRVHLAPAFDGLGPPEE